MSIALGILIVLAHIVALLLDFLVVLIVVRLACSVRRLPWLAECNDAGRPLVDRATRSAAAWWERAFPDRPLFGRRLLAVTALCVLLLQWAIQAVVAVALA